MKRAGMMTLAAITGGFFIFHFLPLMIKTPVDVEPVSLKKRADDIFNKKS